jgi:hypothetical protein
MDLSSTAINQTLTHLTPFNVPRCNQEKLKSMTKRGALVRAIRMILVLGFLLTAPLGVMSKERHYRAKCSEYRSQEGVGGYVCTNIMRGSSFAKAGIQNGDIVVSIDQVPLDGPKTAQTMLDDIENRVAKEIIIRRSGEEITLAPKYR